MLGFSSISELALAQLPVISIHISGVNSTGIAGDETVIAKAVVEGFAASGSVGTLGDESITANASISITGFSTTLSLGDILIWGEILPGVTTNYSNISTGASQTWTDISTGASQTWTEVA
jgi:hypothetical protein